MKSAHNPNLFRLVMRVSKEDSAFTYFTFEASEGLAFFSTLDESLTEAYRDIEMVGSIHFYPEVIRTLEKLRDSFAVTIISDEKFIDGSRPILPKNS